MTLRAAPALILQQNCGYSGAVGAAPPAPSRSQLYFTETRAVLMHTTAQVCGARAARSGTKRCLTVERSQAYSILNLVVVIVLTYVIDVLEE